MQTLTAKLLLHILQISLQLTYIQWNQSHNYTTRVKKVRQYLYLEQLSTLVMTRQAENVLQQCNYHISYTLLPVYKSPICEETETKLHFVKACYH